MKKITFNELINLLCEIDYIDEETYPLVFKVNGKGYQAGIGHYCAIPIEDLQNEGFEQKSIDVLKVVNDFFEYQPADEMFYIGGAEHVGEEYYDEELVYPINFVDDSDCMFQCRCEVWVKKICNIKNIKNAEIYLDEEHSFNGNKLPMFYDEFSEDMLKLMEKVNDEVEAEE